MRRINVVTGIKQRLPDILGDDDNINTEESIDGGTVPGITAWSLQAQMIKNLRRIISSISSIGGRQCGRVIQGMEMSGLSGNKLIVSAGYAYTFSGNIIVLGASCNYSFLSDGTSHIYLHHKTSRVDGNVDSTGKETPIIGESGLVNIVFDDYGAIQGSAINNDSFEKIVELRSSYYAPSDGIYLGYITIASGLITGIFNVLSRGMYPNDDGSDYGHISRLKSALITSDSTDPLEVSNPIFTGTIKTEESATVFTGVSGQFTDKNDNVITVKNGLIVDLTS